MKRRLCILLIALLVMPALLAAPALAAESGQDAENEQVTAEEVTVETVDEISELENTAPAKDIVPADLDLAGPLEPAAGSVDRTVYLAEEIYREVPAAAKLYAAVMKLQRTPAWNSGHLAAAARELYRFTKAHRAYLNNHPQAKKAVVLLADETVRLAHRFVEKGGVKFVVYRYAAGTYTLLGCYKRAAAIMELLLKLTPNRQAAYGELRKLYDKAGARGLKVFVRGQRPNFDVRPVIQNGRTLVPIRAIAESLGARVDFDPGEQKVIINNGTININLYLNDRNAAVNGKRVMLEEPAKVINGRTMVPLRFVSENLGAAVDYDPQTQTITVE